MKRFLIILVMTVMFIANCPTAYAAGSEMIYVKFGSYPQTEVPETQALAEADYDANGDCEIGGVRYRRVQDTYGDNYYFRWEPIVWQVVDGLLLARDVIDCKMYDEQEERYDYSLGQPISYCDPVTWEESSLRSWLNEEFVSLAFAENEKDLLAEEVSLFTVERAKAIHTAETQHAYLQKSATDYAVLLGIEPRPTEFSSGDTEWLLQDISPIVSSAVCTIKADGAVNTGISVLLNEAGMGVVPCVKVQDLSALTQWSEAVPEAETLLYRAGGRVAMFQMSDVEQALADGWYLTQEEAEAASVADMEKRFAAWSLAENYDWCTYSNASAIKIQVSQKNMEALEIIDYIKPLIDAFYTGNMDDYMELHVNFPYDKSAAASLSEFSTSIGERIFDIAQACWSNYGNITCAGAGGRQTSATGSGYTINMRLSINGDGAYSESGTLYHDALHRIAAEAKAYSDRPVGQLQYLKVFFAENTVYDGNLFNNEPSTLITSGTGICGTYANFVSDFCKLLNIPCLLLVNEEANHAWNAVYTEGEWYQLDFTSCQTGYSADGIYYAHNPNGFPAEHTAANVDFLSENSKVLGHAFGTHEADDLNEDEYAYVKELLAGGSRPPVQTVVKNGWQTVDGAKYWYENGVKQGTEGRGKEIYDSASDAWYWLDAPDGKMAFSKDVYQESLAGAWGDYIGEDGERYGKWVRYDENGHMIKGWQYTENGTYFFDYTYGTMAKGYATIEGKEYYFNKDTGILEREIGEVPEMGWKNIDGIDYWYEGYVRQGYSVDGSYRGKEIYDSGSDAWYWLDNVDNGKKAVSKDVYQESLAGDWGDYTGADGQKYGKWVRYDENGHMIKGWSTNANGTYYFDLTYGTMAKGEAVIDGQTYYFDVNTGILQ